ncbi:MAG: TrmH family RNA methyltransferase [Patescibacteria group bacterium]|nr:TrmH family RNA methyltransferase [Patescibacteria group bacterium]
MGSDICIILHNIRSVYNVGSIFRTADAAGVDKIILTGYTPTPVLKEKEIAKTALGAEKYLNWEYYHNISYLIKKLQKEGFNIIALEQSKESIPYYKFRPKFPLALICGNEIKGLNIKILNKSQAIVDIPMFGKKESLNVSVAVGIVIYYLKLKFLNLI